MPWMRRVEVIVTRKDDPSKQTIFSSHKIDFEIRSTVGWPADTANITLYNLSLEEVKFLQNKNYGDMYIEIRAGYLDSLMADASTQTVGRKSTQTQPGPGNSIEITQGVKRAEGLGQLPTAFSGIITNVVGLRRPPEHVTQLFCISKAYGASTNFIQMNAIPPGATLEEAIRSMCKDYGFNTISKFGVDQSVMEQTLLRGRTFHDTFLVEFRNLLGEYNLLYTVTTGEVQIFPDSYGNKDAVDRMSKDREPIKLDVNQVIGNPIAGICTYSLNTFINTSFQPGMILDVSPLIHSSHRNADNTISYDSDNSILANGVTSISGQGIILNTDQSIFRWAMEDKYFIMEVVHRGSTHETEFITSITALLGGNTAMGDKEAAWQRWYVSSGMAMESF